MGTFARIVGFVVGVLAGTALGLMGLILILYKGDAGAEGDVEVSFWDTGSVDADILGIALIVIAVALVFFANRALRSRRVS